jgi:hypothetical protein
MTVSLQVAQKVIVPPQISASGRRLRSLEGSAIMPDLTACNKVQRTCSAISLVFYK